MCLLDSGGEHCCLTASGAALCSSSLCFHRGHTARVHLCLASPGEEGCLPLDECLLVSSTQPSFLPFSRVGCALQPYPFSCPWPLSHCLTVAPLTNVLYVKSSSCHMTFCALKLTNSTKGGIYKIESKTMFVLYVQDSGLISPNTPQTK